MKKKLVILAGTLILLTGCAGNQTEGTATEEVPVDNVSTESSADVGSTTDTADAGSNADQPQSAENEESGNEYDDTDVATDESQEGLTVVDGVVSAVSGDMMHETPVYAPATDPNINRVDGYVLVDENGNEIYPEPEERSPEKTTSSEAGTEDGESGVIDTEGNSEINVTDGGNGSGVTIDFENATEEDAKELLGTDEQKTEEVSGADSQEAAESVDTDSKDQ